MEEVCLLLNNMVFCAVGHPEFSQAVADVDLYLAFTAMMKDKRKQFLERVAATPQDSQDPKEGHSIFRRKKKDNLPSQQTRRTAATNPEEEDVRGLKLMVNTIKNYKRFLETEGRLPSMMCLVETDDDPFLDTGLTFELRLKKTLTNNTPPKKGKSEKPDKSPPALKSRKSILPAAFFKDDDDDIMKAIDDTSDSKTLTVEDLEVCLKMCVNEFDLDLSQHHVDPYPDGVQSLPAPFRNSLRLGGQAEVIEGANKKSIFLWRSSHDLVLWEWKLIPVGTKVDDDVDPAYPFSIAISRVNKLQSGVDSDQFTAAAATESISSSKCMVVGGPPLPAYPQGLMLSLKFRDQKERDALLYILATWREASAFGFM